jgi:hypothetical protein
MAGMQAIWNQRILANLFRMNGRPNCLLESMAGSEIGNQSPAESMVYQRVAILFINLWDSPP